MNDPSQRRVPSLLPLPVAAGCLLLAACRVGPDYAPPEPELPDAWSLSLRAEAEVEAAGDDAWWSELQDPVLDELLARASAESPGLRVAAARLREAAALRGVSASEWWPQVVGDGAAVLQGTSRNALPFAPPGIDLDRTYSTLGASASWELDVWGRIARSVESADAGLQASLEDWRDTLVVLHAEIAATYYELRTLQLRLGYARANAQAQEGSLELTRTRFETGLSAELDMRQAELNLAATTALVPRLEEEIARRRNRLAVLVGGYPGDVAGLLLEPRALPGLPDALAVGLPADLLRQRPDVRRAERELAAQHARIGVAEAELYPTFSLSGDLRLEALDGNPLLDGDSLAYGLGPTFRWNLFNAGRVRGLIEVEGARTEAARAAYEASVLRAVEEVENVLVALARERERREQLARAVEAARRSVELVSVQYRSGLTDFQNVLDSQRSLFQQQDALADSEGRLVQLHVVLYRALGGGWRASAEPDPAAASAEPEGTAAPIPSAS
jgi:multidrug efflux system outer membrane protein